MIHAVLLIRGPPCLLLQFVLPGHLGSCTTGNAQPVVADGAPWLNMNNLTGQQEQDTQYMHCDRLLQLFANP